MVDIEIAEKIVISNWEKTVMAQTSSATTVMTEIAASLATVRILIFSARLYEFYTGCLEIL